MPIVETMVGYMRYMLNKGNVHVIHAFHNKGLEGVVDVSTEDMVRASSTHHLQISPSTEYTWT